MSSVILGTDIETREEVRIGDIERRSGLYLLGRPGMGKSALATNISLQDIDHSHGLFFIDPHGDAVVNLLRRGDAAKLKKSAFLFDPEDDDYSFGINLLACQRVESLRARTETYTKAYNVFFKLWEDQFGPWLQLILQNVLWAFIENQDYTLADVPMFLNPRNEEFRNHIISNIKYNQAVADFWRDEFFQRREQDQQERVDAALTRINTLLTHPYVRHIIGQQKTTIDFENLVSTKAVWLFKFSANLAEDIKKFIGTILLRELLYAIRNRPEGKRGQFCIFIDEFHNFASNQDMALMVTEGRKFGVASTFAHVERFGQLADNQKLMGATQATVNKGLFQQTVNDAEEFAPEFAKRVEATEIRREAELVLSPNPVEDIWDRGHPHEDIMWLRGRYFWLVELLKNYPNKKYFVFDPSWTSPEFRRHNPLTFQMQDFSDWDYYCSSADQIRQAISLWNQFLFDWMRGKYDPNEIITEEQVEITIKMIECFGGVLGFLPMLRPYLPPEKRERLLYLMNEKRKQNYEEQRRNKIQIALSEIKHLKEHGIRHEASPFVPGAKFWQGINPNLGRSEIGKRLDAQNEHIKNLSQQILDLEHSQPSQYTSLPSSITSLKNLDEIKAVAIQVGMPSHEVEEFIEWELNPLTTEEREGLFEYIIIETRIQKESLKRQNQIKNMNGIKNKIDNSLNSTRKRRFIGELSSQARQIRTTWQEKEMADLIGYYFLGDIPRILAKDPIKIPSGKYVETLRVERTQQDLNNEMANDLAKLPRYQAYTKLTDESQGKQIVRTHRIQTHPLPEVQSMETEKQAIANGHLLCKERDEVEAEIRARQSRWGRGPGAPRTRGTR